MLYVGTQGVSAGLFLPLNDCSDHIEANADLILGMSTGKTFDKIRASLLNGSHGAYSCLKVQNTLLIQIC